MATDPNAGLTAKVAELQMNVEHARIETQALMAALVVTISALEAGDPGRKGEVTGRLQKLSDSHRRNHQGDLADALARLLREI